MVSERSGRSFPLAGERLVSDWAAREAPFPIAVTYGRLQAELERQEPIAAAWALRDAFECLVEYVACLAVADALQSPVAPEVPGRLAGLLFKPSGLSLGDWHMLLELALTSLEPLARDGRLESSGRRLPVLFDLFFEVRGRLRPRQLNRRIDGDAESFVAWRNRVFGHGVFRQKRAWYAEETLRWLPVLHDFYAALQPILAGWQLTSQPGDGSMVVWQGAERHTANAPHPHQPTDLPISMALRRTTDGVTLDLGPLLSAQTCAVCAEPAAFFFDRHRYERDRERHRTFFREYERGHAADRKEWEPARRLAAHLPREHHWERTSYDPLEVELGQAVVFRDFTSEYQRPTYLHDPIWQLVDERAKGHVQVIGPAEVGKTYLVRGLAEEGRSRGTPVLEYHVRPGALADYRTFAVELAQSARDTLQLRTQEPQTRGTRPDELRQELAAFLGTLRQVNRLDALVLAVDGLDELPEPGPGDATIADLIPRASELPEGCFVVLAHRPELRPTTRAAVDRLREGAREDDSLTLALDPAGSASCEVIRAYLRSRLPERWRGDADLEAILKRVGGVFLYAFHLASALTSGAFDEAAALPTGEQFYPAYLGRLRDRVGEDLYGRVYEPLLLLLAAAQRPVTLQQLTRWGIPADQLPFALLDLRDFLREHRMHGWHESLLEDGPNRYELAHEAFVRWASADHEMAPKLAAAHATIGRQALAAHSGRWTDADAEDDGDLYDLLHIFDHLDAGSLEAVSGDLCLDEGYAASCSQAARHANARARYRVAADLSRRAVDVYGQATTAGRPVRADALADTLTIQGGALHHLRRFRDSQIAFESAIENYRSLVSDGRHDLAPDLARSVMNRGAALSGLGLQSEALAAYDESTDVWRGLENRPLPRVLRQLEGRVREAGYSGPGGTPERASIMNLHGLAWSLMNRGTALQALGRHAEAVTAYDEVIQIRRGLGLAPSDRDHNLARVLANQGVALADAGRLPESLTSHDEAIEIRRALVQSGRSELTYDLAWGLTKRGVVLRRLGSLREAQAAHQEAIVLLRMLVEGGRGELTHELADALVSLSSVLVDLGQFACARRTIDEGAALIEQFVIRESDRAASRLVRTMRHRLLVNLHLQDWTEAARDVRRWLDRAYVSREPVDGGEVVSRERRLLRIHIRQIDAPVLTRLCEALGEDAARFRAFVSGGDDE